MSDPFPAATLRPDGSVEIVAPAVPLLTFRLAQIPATERRRDARRNRWTISAAAAANALRALRAVYPDATIFTARGAA